MIKDPKTASDLARDESTEAGQLAELAHSSWHFVKWHALANPSTPEADILAELPKALSSPSAVELASAIASNRNAPGQALDAILSLIGSSDVDGKRRENWVMEALVVKVLTHDNCPSDGAITFLKRAMPARAIRIKVAKAASNPILLAELKSDISEKVSRAADARGED